MLLLPALGLFTLQRYLLYRRAGRLATIGSRGSLLSARKPPFPARVALFLFCAFFAFLILAQFCAVIAGAFSSVWGIDSSFTTAHVRAASGYRAELLNTIVFSAAAAILTAALASLISFCVFRTELPFRKAADSAAMIPAALPGSLLGLAFVIAFNGGFLPLTGSRAIIVLAMTACELPAAYRICASSIQRLRSTLDDSARALGADRFYLFRTIILPLTFRGLVSAFTFVFVRCTGTLSAVIFLTSFNTKLTSVLILNLAAQGDWGRAASLALILTCLTFGALALLRVFIGRQFFHEAMDKQDV
jgi:iron(III) transport system permease protein